MKMRTQRKLALLEVIRAMVYAETASPTELSHDIADERGVLHNDVLRDLEDYAHKLSQEIAQIVAKDNAR